MSAPRLLDHWSPPEGAGNPVAVLATTFTFQADFFDEDCLARFLSLAKLGTPYEGHVVIEDLQGRPIPEHFLAAIQFQQREHMERSVAYAKKTLDLGIRWRS